MGAEIFRCIEQIGEFDKLIAGHAGNRRFAARIGGGELIDDPLLKALLEIEHKMRNAEPRRDGARILNILARAAGALAMGRFAMIVKLKRHADDVIAALFEQRRNNARVDATGHGDDHAGNARLFRRNRRGACRANGHGAAHSRSGRPEGSLGVIGLN